MSSVPGGERSWRQQIARLLPPVVADWIRGRHQPSRYFWNGVYPRLRDVPTTRADFDGEVIDEMFATVQSARAQLQSGVKPALWHESLALVAGAIVANRKRLHVIDFGGGGGSGFVHLLASLSTDVALDYLVVDNEQACAAGRAAFAGEPRIRFETTLPPIGTAVDLIYINSVLQYVDDYAAVLADVASRRAPFILLARLAAGEQPRFASQQVNLPGRAYPYWFLNLGELAEVMTGAGYRMAADTFDRRTYDLTNLPMPYRLERFRNVLFVRTDAA